MLRLSNSIARPATDGPVIHVARWRVVEPADGAVATELRGWNFVKITAAVESPAKGYRGRTGLDLARQTYSFVLEGPVQLFRYVERWRRGVLGTPANAGIHDPLAYRCDCRDMKTDTSKFVNRPGRLLGVSVRGTNCPDHLWRFTLTHDFQMNEIRGGTTLGVPRRAGVLSRCFPIDSLKHQRVVGQNDSTGHVVMKLYTLQKKTNTSLSSYSITVRKLGATEVAVTRTPSGSDSVLRSRELGRERDFAK